ncbi:hypothetical protein BVG19_g1597 [[Candida] boidinii]|nr:hypothetical protein BVG19_g1597 [[Candida] boidinii]OWB49900.1 hypothetical protein B5S27_g1445 [[Candida] boidinii]
MIKSNNHNNKPNNSTSSSSSSNMSNNLLSNTNLRSIPRSDQISDLLPSSINLNSPQRRSLRQKVQQAQQAQQQKSQQQKQQHQQQQLQSSPQRSVASTTSSTVRILRKRTSRDFQFGDCIGEGSYSRVFKAISIHNKKTYAVKILSKSHIQRENKRKYVNIEKVTLNLLGKHMGIVTLHYTFQDENSLYFVIDFAKHGELLSLINKLGSLSENLAKYYMIQLIDAIEFIHSKNIIHRDLKPENILLNSDWKLMITDFGAAKIVSTPENQQPPQQKSQQQKQPQSETQSQSQNNNESNGTATEDNDLIPNGSFVGTAEYVSPELLQYNLCGFESDYWAIGCIIFQFIVGRPPFKGNTEYLTFEKIISLNYNFPDYFIPDSIKSIIEKLLVLDPLKRLNLTHLKSENWFNNFDWKNKELIWNTSVPKLEPYNARLSEKLNNNNNINNINTALNASRVKTSSYSNTRSSSSTPSPSPSPVSPSSSPSSSSQKIQYPYVEPNGKLTSKTSSIPSSVLKNQILNASNNPKLIKKILNNKLIEKNNNLLESELKSKNSKTAASLAASSASALSSSSSSSTPSPTTTSTATTTNKSLNGNRGITINPIATTTTPTIPSSAESISKIIESKLKIESPKLNNKEYITKRRSSLQFSPFDNSTSEQNSSFFNSNGSGNNSNSDSGSVNTNGTANSVIITPKISNPKSNTVNAKDAPIKSAKVPVKPVISKKTPQSASPTATTTSSVSTAAAAKTTVTITTPKTTEPNKKENLSSLSPDVIKDSKKNLRNRLGLSNKSSSSNLRSVSAKLPSNKSPTIGEIDKFKPKQRSASSASMNKSNSKTNASPKIGSSNGTFNNANDSPASPALPPLPPPPPPPPTAAVASAAALASSSPASSPLQTAPSLSEILGLPQPSSDAVSAGLAIGNLMSHKRNMRSSNPITNKAVYNKQQQQQVVNPILLDKSIPKDITSKLMANEYIIKLDNIFKSELTHKWSSRTNNNGDNNKNNGNNNLSLDDEILSKIISDNYQKLNRNIKSCILIITSTARLFIYEINSDFKLNNPQSSTLIQTMEFYSSFIEIRLTNRNISMYDYEFDEETKEGYLILELINLNKLIFLTSYNSKNLIKGGVNSNVRVGFRVNENIGWIESLLKAKELLRSNGKNGNTNNNGITQSPITTHAPPLRKSKSAPENQLSSSNSEGKRRVSTTNNTTTNVSSKSNSNSNTVSSKPGNIVKRKSSSVNPTSNFAAAAAAAAKNSLKK